MPQINIHHQVDKVIADAIELADIGGIRVSNQAIAERIYDSELDLMRELQRPWMLDRLLWIISRKRRNRFMGQQADDNPTDYSVQLVLPGFEGLPRTIFLKNGKRHRLDFATTQQVAEHIAMLKARMDESPKIARFEAVLKLMRKYSDAKPDIRWIEVKRAELKLD
jgi:hypothetical protein